MRKLVTFLLIVAGVGFAHYSLGYPMPSLNNPLSIIGLMGGLLLIAGVVVLAEAVSNWFKSKDKASEPLVVGIFHVILVALFIFVLVYIYKSFIGRLFVPF